MRTHRHPPAYVCVCVCVRVCDIPCLFALATLCSRTAESIVSQALGVLQQKLRKLQEEVVDLRDREQERETNVSSCAHTSRVGVVCVLYVGECGPVTAVVLVVLQQGEYTAGGAGSAMEY